MEEQQILTIKSFLSLVDLTLKKNQNNLKKIFELKTFLTNFSLSLKDEGYVEAIKSNEYLMQIINSILNSFDLILKYFLENSKKNIIKNFFL
jgi:hypothetical protein